MFQLMLRSVLLAPFGALAFVGIVIVMGLIFAFPVMWLWNYVVPLQFGLKPIDSVWHAWALLVLCGLLFKSGSSK